MAATFTDRVALKIAGFQFRRSTEVTIERDLQNIAGRFNVTCIDQQRIAQSLPAQPGQGLPFPVKLLAGQACELAIDGEAVLVGYIGRPGGKWSGSELAFRFCGRDKVGDLVDCAGLPNGPSEFRNVDLLSIATKICTPFGITVRKDVDIGAPFRVLALYPHETGLSILEKGARQRSVLLVSDGVGGLLLTRGGSSRGPAPLRIGELIQESNWEHDHDHRFSDYFVKGQTAPNRAGSSAPLTSTVTPTGAAPAATPGAATAKEKANVAMLGHAIDPEITRWRPTVKMIRTQSGMSSVQEQAEWALRVARGQADRIEYTVLDWRAPNGQLWRPNQVVPVWDPYAGIDGDMLIAGVTYRFNERDGARTSLRLVGVTAYDRVNATVRRRHHRAATQQQQLDSSAKPFQAM